MHEFLDYYEMLQISPNAEPETIQRVYRMLATRYHPDNHLTGDADRFLKLKEAYDVLTDEQRRAAYDEDYRLRRSGPLQVFEQREFVVGVEAEGNRRLGILCLLYNRRRDDACNPAMSLLDLESVMLFPREHLEFTAWYLREKGFIRRDDHGELMITAEGVDYVEERRRDNAIMQRLLMPPASVVNGRVGLRATA
jgi:curved DNA-binding protein CbpA